MAQSPVEIDDRNTVTLPNKMSEIVVRGGQDALSVDVPL